MRGLRGSLAARLAGLFTLGTMLVFALLGVSLVLMLRGELRARDTEEIDSKTKAVEHHLAEVRTEQELERSLSRFVDTEVGHTNVRLGVWLDGRWLLAPSGPLATRLPERDIASIAGNDGFDTVRIGEETWWIRRITHPIRDARSGAAQAIVALDVSEAQRVQDRFNVALAMIGTTGILMMTGLAWWAARRGLDPLERIAFQAQRVTAQRLGEPLSIEEAPEEVRGVVAALNTMLARLDESFRSLEQFSADIAHELRTPLNSLTLRVEVTLSRDRSADEYEDALHGTMQELERLQKMVSDMLFIARTERGMAAITTETVDLRSEASEVAEYFEPLASERGIVIVIDGSARVTGDRLMIRRAITNLLSNAVRYSTDASEVTVRIEAVPDAVRLKVRNRCAPLTQGQMEHLFDRFARGDSARERQTDGTGLGLAIVRSIMGLHSGQAMARPVDDGLEVVLTWPLRDGSSSQERRQAKVF